ncbi:class I SAM-dependent methyltransferase [Aquimarina sp. 2201CG14-23]|uniref:class I SAM-dependent methyltransferase n=1 Tax=Aquimarina mycalae TaxID=3040073 RepID=UPI0024780F81|nr:class I SAM-dependent methyltransferase [Aquimarina sp. 2201CG14-23]MDH7445157.1 class I SAM-dependent methyltransferase [Aquimarina sp. 2201CG14-23]
MSKCIYCKSSNHQKWSSFKDIFDARHQLYSCNDCGIYFLNPQPTVDQLIQAYDDHYYGVGEDKFNPTVEKVVEWFRQQNSKAFASKLPNKACVLDIGCGNGSFLVNLGKQKDVELHGIELKGRSAERASQHPKIQLHIGVLEENTYSLEKFDAIVLTHVFEHLDNPKETLRIIDKIAKSYAILQIEIPNINSWQAQIFKGNWLHLDPPKHLNLFPPKILKKELSKLGWQITSEHYFSPQFSPFGVQQSILNVILPKREILYEHLKGNKDYTKEFSTTHLFSQKLFHWLSFPLFVITDGIASLFKKGGTVKMVFRKMPRH